MFSLPFLLSNEITIHLGKIKLTLLHSAGQTSCPGENFCCRADLTCARDDAGFATCLNSPTFQTDVITSTPTFTPSVVVVTTRPPTTTSRSAAGHSFAQEWYVLLFSTITVAWAIFKCPQ